MEARQVEVLIVGSGFAGLGMAIQLKQAGMDDFLVLERAGEVGGTWRDNTYPGCMCDVPSSLYSFSFAQKWDWSCTYPKQGEIWEYLRRCAARFGVRPHILFRQELLSAEWDPKAGRWTADTQGARFSARFIVLAAGALSEPRIPALPGLTGFAGETFHSARWPHDLDLGGRRVAVVGTGASAVQLVPEIQPLVARLHLFQRNPAWILPHPNRRLSRAEQWLGKTVPSVLRLRRAGVYAGRELLVVGLAMQPRLLRLGEHAALLHLRRQVHDPALRRALTPRYRLGCKRIVISNDFYPALTQPNVELIPQAITAVREHSVVAADGTERDVDTIIFGTGFQVAEFPIAQRIRSGGVVLGERWQGSPEAYLGTTVSGFPNLFVMTGPNTGLGHTSMVHIIESQVRYVKACMDAANHDGGVIAVRPEVERAYNHRLQQRMRRTVWTTGGCASWYLDAKGRNTTLWPSFTFSFRWRTARFDPTAYVAGGAARPATPAPS